MLMSVPSPMRTFSATWVMASLAMVIGTLPPVGLTGPWQLPQKSLYRPKPVTGLGLVLSQLSTASRSASLIAGILVGSGDVVGNATMLVGMPMNRRPVRTTHLA